MRSALIGWTGFVGSTLLAQRQFDERYNSKNIQDLMGRHFDLLVCAGAPAEKWKANSDPKQDRASLSLLLQSLESCTARRVILISTVDVYPHPESVDEQTSIDPGQLQPYGLHRFQLEQFVGEHFPGACIARLPGLFGVGLKKNLIFDLLAGKYDWTDHRSWFQFYDMSRLWSDLDRLLVTGLPLVNFATAPVLTSEVARRCFGLEYTTTRDERPARYDLRTRNAELFGGHGHYFYDAEETYSRLRRFVESRRAPSVL